MKVKDYTQVLSGKRADSRKIVSSRCSKSIMSPRDQLKTSKKIDKSEAIKPY